MIGPWGVYAPDLCLLLAVAECPTCLVGAHFVGRNEQRFSVISHSWVPCPECGSPQTSKAEKRRGPHSKYRYQVISTHP